MRLFKDKELSEREKMSPFGSEISHQWVRRSWFKHFYVFAAAWSVFVLFLVSIVYLGVLESAPNVFLDFLDLFDNAERQITVGRSSALLASFLMTVQSWKRMYETQCVSVFSSGKIDVGQYVLGYLHYFGAVIATVMETPGFTRTSSHSNDPGISNIEWGAAVLFLFFWAAQHDCARILANLRKGPKGKVLSNKHLVPRGRLFEYVSSPHFFCEIMLYLCLYVILYRSSLYCYILLWVLSNQIEVALLTHWWYLKEFKNYPKQRKAIIPWIL